MVIQAKLTPEGNAVLSGAVVIHRLTDYSPFERGVDARFAVDTQSSYSLLSGGVVRRLGLSKKDVWAEVEVGDFEARPHRVGLVPGFLSIEHEVPILRARKDVTRFGLAFGVSLNDVGRFWDGIPTDSWDNPDSLIGKDVLHFLSRLRSGRDSAWKDPVERYELRPEAAKVPAQRTKGAYQGGYRVRTVHSERYLKLVEMVKKRPTIRGDP